MQSDSMAAVRKQQARVVRSIGERLREARLLCNLSQQAAAKRFGYANSSKLAKVEGVTDTRSVPLWLIARASEVYEVSIDYLFGVTDDWETGARMTQERETSAWLFEAWEKMRRRDLEVLRKFQTKQDALTESVSHMLSAADNVESALIKFRALNPSFDSDLKGGARLVSAVSRVVETAQSSNMKLKRLKVDCRLAAASDTSQLSLFL